MCLFTKNLIEFHQKPHFMSSGAFLQMSVWSSTDRLILIFYDVFIAKDTSDIKIEAKSMGKHIYYRVLEARYKLFDFCIKRVKK